MEKLKTLIVMLLLAVTAQAQTAKEVLDKTAAVVSSKKGVTGHFNINSSNGVGMKASGTIAVKGKKFHAVTPQATIWFDGKTMWTYLKQNDEVNISTPTSSQLATINPYNFIFMYKQGYSYTMEKVGKSYYVHLKTTDKKKQIQEIDIKVYQKTFVPWSIYYRTSKGVTTIDISDFKVSAQPDAVFCFNSKDFPTAEVIDLR